MTENLFYRHKKILVTGGLGFIGSNLVIRLVSVGAKVTIIDSLIPEYGGNLFNIEPVKNRVRWVRGDIRERDVVDKAVRDQDIIFNLAGTLSHIDSMTDPMTEYFSYKRAYSTRDDKTTYIRDKIAALDGFPSEIQRIVLQREAPWGEPF